MLDKKYINQLVKAAQKGDRDAFARVVEGHYDMIYRIAFKWCANQEDAQDITQDVCVKLAMNIQKFNFKSAFSSWLYRVTLNSLRDYKRKNKERHNLPIDELPLASNETAQDEKAYQRQIWEQILAAVNDLPLKQRAAILLTATEGLTHKQASEVMGVKESTVSWYIHEGRKKLQYLLETLNTSPQINNQKGGRGNG